MRLIKIFGIYSYKHICLFLSNYAYSDMFRFVGVIIRLFVETYRRYIKVQRTFWDPKKFTFKDTRKIITVFFYSDHLYFLSCNMRGRRSV